MNLAAVLKNLKAAGTAQTRKTYGRHGIPEPMFGVSFAHLNKLAKQIETDQKLAEQLWDTGNFDCRSLALMIADPETIKSSTLQKWGKETDNHGLAGMVGNFTAQTPHAWKLASRWCEAKSELLSTAGWSTVAVLALHEDHADHEHGPDEPCAEDAPLDELFATCLAAIEKNIDAAPNYTRHAMNGALISIGGRNVQLRQLALAAAKRIGPVEVDHGDTSCKTPDAQAYIKKMWGRKAEAAAKGKKPRKRSVC
jgi:3-methyladenine DNA glycosylase AlkD